MLHIIGDIDLTEGYFDKGLGIGNSLVDKKEDPFEYLSRRDDDLWIGNFECVCSDVQATGSPFIINPCHLEHIRHFDCYGIANNHIPTPESLPDLLTLEPFFFLVSTYI